MTNEDYFAVEALSASTAKLLLRSPAHYLAAKLSPSTPSPAMQFGTAVHAAVLEPHLPAAFTIRPADLDRRTKDGKARFAELEASGLPVLTQDQADAIGRIRDNVLAVPYLREAIEGGTVEQPVFWNGRDVPCKCKPDLVFGDVIFDLKTCQDASPAGFLSSIRQYGYAIQARHYLDGTGFADFVFVAVETSAPFAVGVYRVSELLLEQADAALDVAADRFRRGITAGAWPAYPAEIVTLGPQAVL